MDEAFLEEDDDEEEVEEEEDTTDERLDIPGSWLEETPVSVTGSWWRPAM
jgi:hypothetical protein